MERTCKMEGCKREYRAKGYCNVHYKKWRRGELDKKPRYKICSEENCKGETYKSGRCKPHYDAWIASRKKVEAEVVATPAVEAAPAVEVPVEEKKVEAEVVAAPVVEAAPAVEVPVEEKKAEAPVEEKPAE